MAPGAAPGPCQTPTPSWTLLPARCSYPGAGSRGQDSAPVCTGMMTASNLLPTGVAWISGRDFIDAEGAYAERLQLAVRLRRELVSACSAFASTPLRRLPLFRQHHHARVPQEMHPQGVERAHTSSPCGACAPAEEPLKHVRQRRWERGERQRRGGKTAKRARSDGGRRREQASRVVSRPQVGASPCRSARLAGTRPRGRG